MESWFERGLEEIERKGSQKAVASLVLGSHWLLSHAAPDGGMHAFMFSCADERCNWLNRNVRARVQAAE